MMIPIAFLTVLVVWACLLLLTLPILMAIMRSSQISREEERMHYLDVGDSEGAGTEREDNNS